MSESVADLERRIADLEDLLARERSARRTAVEQAMANAAALRVLAREVRAPLDAALSWSRMVRQELLSKSGRDHALRVVERQIDGSMLLIDDLLAVVAMSTPKIARLRFDEVVRAAHDAVAKRADARKLTFTLDAAEVELRADPARTERLAVRFLETALALAQEGTTIAVVLDEKKLACTFVAPPDLPELPPASWDAVVAPDGVAQPMLVSLFLLQRLAEAQSAHAEIVRDENGARLVLTHLPVVPHEDSFANEVRTPLQVLTIGVDLLRTRVRDSADDVPREWLLDRLDQLEESVERLGAIADRFSASAAPRPLPAPSAAPRP